jgi:hypothetical protein
MLSGKTLPTPDSALALLNARRLPARLNTTEVAVLLGFQEHDIKPLMSGGMLKPLGKPAANSPKYFAAVDIAQHATDRDWLSRATREIGKHWSVRNGRKKALNGERES